jgi:hypothetical protein
MLLGLLALPALAAIYWLRSRSKRAVVSSLVFWTDQRRPRQGGRILERLQTPLTFFLELLAILFLVLAAAGPAMLKKDVARPLCVVLDNSYSMQANSIPANAGGSEQDTARHRAELALIEELNRDNYVARFILAGAQSRLLGEPLREPGLVRETLAHWNCPSATADLPAALALAAEVGGPAARILVLTDHQPAMMLDGGQTQWWAFGNPLPNIAFTAATRTTTGDTDRVLLEIANLSDTLGSTTLTLEGGNLASPQKSNIELAGGTVRQLFLNLPKGATAFQATLNNDALDIDNHVLLLPESTKPLRVRIELADERLRQAVTKALEATEQIIEVTDRPELAITDQPDTAEGDAWRLNILGGKEGEAYTGPFVIDHTHPLSEGLSLQNVVWSTSPDVKLSGTPIVTAGNVLLMTDHADFAGRHRLQMGFVEKLSNFQDMPDWPILFANLVQWERANLPGVMSPNVRLGQTVAVTLAHDASKLEVLTKGEPPMKLDMHGRHAEVPAEQVGLHTIKTADAEYPFACNAISRDESDLRNCATGRWGNWAQSPTHQDRQTSLRWVFLLLALAVMAVHLIVVARNAGGRNI